nr:MAG TPA: hypothetical protein [Caudoviricetes sp.]
MLEMLLHLFLIVSFMFVAIVHLCFCMANCLFFSHSINLRLKKYIKSRPGF